jgi:hypothetical protein
MSRISTGASALPDRPSMEFLRKLAKDRLAESRQSNPAARLFEAQLQIAREHGFASWRELAAHVGEMSPASLRRTDGRVWIEGIPALTWSGNGSTTYAGALELILRVIGPAHSYTRLLGDSGLAFRMRWWSSEDGISSCPSSPVGEFSPWTDIAARSIGWKMRWKTHLMGITRDDHADMSIFRQDVVTSIDAGLPLLTYAKSWDIGIVYGYEEEGRRLLVRDYYVDKECVIGVHETRGLFAFFEDQTSVPSWEESSRIGIANGLEYWSHVPTSHRRNNLAGAYHYGLDAYERWIDMLGRTGDLAGETHQKLNHVSFWTHTVLHDARLKAADYLREAMMLYPAESRAAILSAADFYQRAGEISGEAMRGKRLFQVHWGGRGLEAWTPSVRKEEIALLEKVRSLDERAISALRSAVM